MVTHDVQVGRPAWLPAVKVVVTGGVGAGTSTFVHAVSQLGPARVAGPLTGAGWGAGDACAVMGRTTATVGLDFGRASLDQHAAYVFGMPGGARFWFMWDSVLRGALGVLVLVAAADLVASFPVLDNVQASGLPFVVAVNRFERGGLYPRREVREALRVPGDVPVLTCDARERGSALQVLQHLVDDVLAGRLGRASRALTCAPASAQQPADLVGATHRDSRHGGPE